MFSEIGNVYPHRIEKSCNYGQLTLAAFIFFKDNMLVAF